ncbi:hypothetical protein [Asanoa sp. NPDC050611]|uniref:hypothetical protein n=1 Tax=Asanoa sp. NPDC050611 TaxID=3157098 RepID=UPI0033F74D9C
MTERPDVPPVASPGHWDPVWAAAVAVALARLLVASGGAPVSFPDGLVADVFRPALDALPSTGAPTKTLELAGPGLPTGGRRPGARPGASADRSAMGVVRDRDCCSDLVGYLVRAGCRARPRTVAGSRHGRRRSAAIYAE